MGITEVMLAAEGFEQHTPLASTLECMRTWCQENFSKQHCYDFGLRALKQIITAAGAELRAQPAGSEKAHVMCALWSTLGSRCVTADRELLEGRLSEVWPEEEAVNSASFLTGLPGELRSTLARVSAEEAMQWKLGQVLALTQRR